MKMYKKPLIDVKQMEAMSVLMTSPGGNIQSTPGGGTNNPGGFGGAGAPKHRPF